MELCCIRLTGPVWTLIRRTSSSREAVLPPASPRGRNMQKSCCYVTVSAGLKSLCASVWTWTCQCIQMASRMGPARPLHPVTVPWHAVRANSLRSIYVSNPSPSAALQNSASNWCLGCWKHTFVFYLACVAPPLRAAEITNTIHGFRFPMTEPAGDREGTAISQSRRKFFWKSLLGQSKVRRTKD